MCSPNYVIHLAHKVNERHLSEAEFADDMCPNRDDFECDLISCDLVDIYDSPRLESLDSVLACHRAGIVAHVLTEDRPQTARAVVNEVGILPPPEKARLLPADVCETIIMAAHDFNALSDDQIDALSQLPLVITRLVPRCA